MNSSILRFVNVLLAALLAGTSFGLWYGFDPSSFSGPTYIELHQSIVRSFSVLMTVLVVIATLVTVASAYQQRHNRTNFLLLAASAFFFVCCIAISGFGNRPIDNLIMSWSQVSVPADWEQHRDKWRLYHGLRTLVELLALGLVTWASIRKKRLVPLKS